MNTAAWCAYLVSQLRLGEGLLVGDLDGGDVLVLLQHSPVETNTRELKQ
jgi:hypothetical protein